MMLRQNADYLANFNSAIVMVKDAIMGEKRDELFYDYLMENALDDNQRSIIESIRDDEIRHNGYFRNIYRYLTGEEVQGLNEVDLSYPDSYLAEIKDALFGELSAVKRYRDIRKYMPNMYFRDLVFGIITDELRHANMYNYIITLNS